MRLDEYILPPDSLLMIVAGFTGVGFLITIGFTILAILKSKSLVCKPAEKEDVEKLNTIDGLHVIKDDSEDMMSSGKSWNEKKPKKKSKKEV